MLVTHPLSRPVVQGRTTIADRLVPIRIGERLSTRIRDLALICVGAVFIAATANFAFVIPGNPIPVTGQTLSVLVVGGAPGLRRGMMSVAVHPQQHPHANHSVALMPYTPPVDATGATEVSAALNAWLATVPDGSTVDFATGGSYQLAHGALLSGQNSITLDLHGSTLWAAAGASGTDITTSLIRLMGCTHISVVNYVLTGNAPDAVYHAGTEFQHGVYVNGGSDISIGAGTIQSVYGDGVYNNGGTVRLTVASMHVISACRMGVALTAASTVSITGNTFDAVGYAVLDMEPNYSGTAVSGVTFSGNTIGTWGQEFVAANGVAGSIVENVTVNGNTITGSSLRTVITLARRTNIAFTNNVSTHVSTSGTIFTFTHIDGLTFTGNVQPFTSGNLAAITDCTAVV
jgi:hypothetical protein